jgi:DNA-binding NarL/FixJ family response regulator
MAKVEHYKMRRIKLLVASSCPLFRKEFHTFLQWQDDIKIVGEVTNPLNISSRVEVLSTDILVLHIAVLNSDITEILHSVHIRSPGTKALIATGRLPKESIVEALQWGARGFLLTPCPQETFAKRYQWEICFKAICAIDAGDIWMSRNVLAQVLEYLIRNVKSVQESPPLKLLGSLTDREREVVSWVVKGMSNKETAKQLGISDKTVKKHLDHIFNKLEIHRRTQLLPYL